MGKLHSKTRHHFSTITINLSVSAYYDKKASMVGLFFQKVFVLVDLHTIEMPDRPRMQIIENIPNYFNYINQVIPLPDDRWMIFLSYPTYGAYCIIDNVTTTTEVASIQFLQISS